MAAPTPKEVMEKAKATVDSAKAGDSIVRARGTASGAVAGAVAGLIIGYHKGYNMYVSVIAGILAGGIISNILIKQKKIELK